MVEDYRKEDFERLKSEVETLVGRKIASPKDFAFLMRQIHGYTQETISVSTLKRMWGYVNSNTKHSKFNLDLLSRMVGYAGWDAFVAGAGFCSLQPVLYEKQTDSQCAGCGRASEIDLAARTCSYYQI